MKTNTKKLIEKWGAVTIQVCTKNRIGELCVFLQSLRTQTYKKWNLLLLDDASDHPIQHNEMFQKLINQVRLEKHKVKLMRNDFSLGVCKARNKLIEKDTFNNLLIARCDDDVVLEQDYLERLVGVIDRGADLASGITPNIGTPELKRLTKYVKPNGIINEIKFDAKGNILEIGDCCGMSYFNEDNMIPTHHFRSCAVYKKKITDEGLRYELGLNWFREEAFFSFRAILKGYKLFVDPNAKVFHFMNQSGGCRSVYPLANIDEMNFKLWSKRMYEVHGNFLEAYDKELKEKGIIKRSKK